MEDLTELVLSASKNLGSYEYRYDMKYVLLSASTPITVVLPSLDKELTFVKVTATTVTLAPGGVDTFPNSETGIYNSSAATYATISFKKTSANKWYVLGKIGTWNFASGATLS